MDKQSIADINLYYRKLSKRDKIVNGLNDGELSNKLQTEPNLSLVKAVQVSREYEATSWQRLLYILLQLQLQGQ